MTKLPTLLRLAGCHKSHSFELYQDKGYFPDSMNQSNRWIDKRWWCDTLPLLKFALEILSWAWTKLGCKMFPVPSLNVLTTWSVCYSPSVRLCVYTIARDSCMRLVGTRYYETKCARRSAPTFCCHRPDPLWKLWKTSSLSQRASRQSVLVTSFQLTSSLLPSLSADHHCAASNCPTSSWASET